jgi:regulation of enolase protein 1 (concanavalin A-like superfamily)
MQQFKMGLKDERVQIRLERRNGRLHAAASYDGRLWQGYEPVAVDLPDRVQIGITAISTSSVPFEPEFEGLEIYRRVAPVGQKNEDAR